MLSSHALLIAAFLLQYDVGDGPGWLKISAILEGGPRGQYTMTPTWWPKEMEMRINLLLFVPVLATWIVLLRTIRMNLLLFVPILATWLMLMMARQ
jgi:hypothetical protein